MQILFCLVATGVLGTNNLLAQVSSDSLAQEGTEVSYEFNMDPSAAVVPFGPGEKLTYQVKIGIVNSG